MNGIPGVIHIYSRQKLSWFYLPWAITAFSFLINYIISVLVNGEAFYAGGLATIFIYVFIAALVSVLQLFPFSLGFSIRRTDFYLGSVLMVVAYSVITSIILLALAEIERFTSSWGDRISFFKLPYLNDGTLFEQFIIYFILLLTFAFIGIGIGVFYLRHRGIKTFVMFAAYFIILSGASVLVTQYGWWGQVIDWVVKHTAFELSLWLIPISVILALVSYRSIRKSSV
ncbi:MULTISPECIES: hypothetical protein [Paenibacillus]|uniref:Uncharacterized protein n=1 Tax=Paenibacillus lautus TaxID=1401 RepID=A0A1R1B6F2_PAELA|nr:hypothetical protein [Paenibacillus lautus]OME95089.1 hypothetical protein BK123_08365 [Paenibacillus lautus]